MSSKVSSSKGKAGQKKQGQNAVALKIASIPIEGVCKHCTDILEWKQRMGKYKPLSQPKTCLACNRKKIVHAYHTHCLECAQGKNICAKCHETTIEIVNPFAFFNSASTENEVRDIEAKVQRLSERKRRSYHRKIENGDESGAASILNTVGSESDSSDFEEFDDEVAGK